MLTMEELKAVKNNVITIYNGKQGYANDRM